MKTDIVYEPLKSKRYSTMEIKTLKQFLLFTFALTWGLAAILILFSDQVFAIFGNIGLSNPLVILAVYSPGFVGVLLIKRYYGWKGLGRYFQRLTRWRAPLIWWLFLILGLPAVVYTGAVIKGVPLLVNFSPWYPMLPALLHALFLGPIEEFGWRGLALPILQRIYNPFWAGLILGGIWASWHIPSFLISGMPQTTWSVFPYFLGIVAISVILTALFNASKGSLLISILFHFQMMNPLFPDAQPYDNLLWIVVAIIIVWFNRRTMFDNSTGITDVLLPENRVTIPETSI